MLANTYWLIKAKRSVVWGKAIDERGAKAMRN